VVWAVSNFSSGPSFPRCSRCWWSRCSTTRWTASAGVHRANLRG